MPTKVFQRGNFVIIEQSTKENPIPIDNFDYDFVTADSVKLKDVVESTELNAATADLQKENGDPIGSEILAKAHFATFIKSSMGGGGVGGGDATLAEQQEQTSILGDLEDYTKRKFIGTRVELANSGGNWQGFPVESTELILSINGVETSYPMNDVESINNQQLAEQLNLVQNVLVFDWVRDSIDIVFNGVGASSPEVTGIKIEDNNTGTLEYTSFTASTDEETGAVQQMAVLMQKQLQLLQDFNSKTPKLAATISLSYAGNLEYNLTTDADIDGKTIPLGSFGDISSIQDLDAGNVNYRFDSGTPSASYPTINGNRAFDKLTNVDFNTFRIKAGAGGAAYTIIINLYK